MSLDRKYSIYRKIAVFMAINLLVQIISPTAAWALTGGPSSPEFSSFEPVATTNMVSEFSGDLTYNLPVVNIPGANGGGYAMSLSYHSGTTPEEEASWVGYGWTLNPGAINRGKKGFPDDWNGTTVKYHNKTPANQTVAIGGSLGNIEVFSFDLPVSVNSSIRYNNYKGFGYTIGAGLSLAKGVVSLGYNISDGTGSFSLSLNPANALRKGKDDGDKADYKTEGSRKEVKKAKQEAKYQKALEDYNKRKDNKNGGNEKITAAGILNGLGSGYGIHNFASESRPTQIVGYSGISTTVSLSLLLAPSPLQAGISVGAFGSYSRQENYAVSDLNTYGYMYSSGAGSNAMMDYFVEKGSVYTKQDKFLGIPFSNADDYVLAGEGLSGGFKLHNRNAGYFHPNAVTSSTSIFNAGAEFEVGVNWGGGVDVGIGHQSLSIGSWQSYSNNGFSVNQDESNFFRFVNDKGGELSYDLGNTAPKQANVYLTYDIPGIKSASPDITGISPIIKTDNNSYNRSLRSSYIGYNTNSDMTVPMENSIAYRAYAKNTNAHISNDTINRSSNPSQIGEFSIVNEDGNRYNYGIPVLSGNEKNLQVDLNGIGSANIENRFLVYRDVTGSTETKVGEERLATYATSYLLTDITSPDYIDRSNNGPSDDDFGGYTKFIYKKIHNEYKWRMPYAGLSYNRNELSNPNDDLGSVAEGKKEIFYLDSVVTKTHYAVFYTSDRRDGVDANGSETTASTNPAAQGSNKLKKLDRIELYAKDLNGSSDKLIKTVHFEYDYSLCRGVLNSLDKTSTDPTLGGKLTLKKVWFEYNGVVEAKISPYQFEYQYPTTADADYPARYNAFENYGSGLIENPAYSPFNIDAWGNYQNDGAARYSYMKPWLNQNAQASSMAAFDPAAWQLKVIKLPSGGEIHVQYEQDDYCYVQDKEAQAMISLKEGSSNHNNGSFVLEANDFGITTLADKQKLTALIKKEYISGNKKMYFKMLYKLIGNATPNLNDCNVEYITGYANVSNVYLNGSNDIVINLKQGDYTLPKQVCQDYVTTQRAGNLSFVGSNCDPSNGATIGGGSPPEKVLSFIGQAATWIASLAPGTTCLEVNYPYSYLKIPLLEAKKGGGVRVKRLLMFDKGIESGTSELYGSEYVYKTYDDNRKEFRSSGVATNEPSSIREENALVGFLDRFKQSFGSKVISGRDKEQSEGPLGESILPGASVGYSKIITKSIHSGKTNPGFAIKEFYTAKNYPVKMNMTGIDQEKDYLPLMTGLVNKITNNLWLSQGFSFEINSMHGQLRSSSTYAGSYTDILNPNLSTLVSQEVLTYFQPGEELPILDLNDLSYTSTMPLGKEMDMVNESKTVQDINIDGNVEMDADIGLFGFFPIPFITGVPSMTYTETKLFTHTTTKITSYPAILKSTKSYADGIYHLSENIAFNSETGQPIMVRTTDGFDHLNLLASNNHDGSYTKYSFPASLQYDNMSQKAKNEQKIVSTGGGIHIDKIIENEKTYLFFSAEPPLTVCDAMSNFVGGDLIKLSSGGIYHIGDVYGSKIEIQPTNYCTSCNGTGYTDISMEIIKSGRTNQLNTMVGSLTTYGKDSVIITPADSATLALRQDFADLLNESLTDTNSIDTIFPNEIPEGIELFLNGTCGALDTNYFITLLGNTVNIYSGGYGYDTLIIPNHPMVDTLNHYLNYFYDYDLDPTGFNYLCGDTSSSYRLVISIDNSSYDAMTEEQDTILSRQFSGVNGGFHAINEYFEWIDIGGSTNATFISGSPARVVNKVVLLEEIATNNVYGANLSCQPPDSPLFCQGCTIGEPSYGGCSGGDMTGIGEFIETENGDLVYQTILYVDGYPTYNCPTNIRFYQTVPAFPELICSSTLDMSGGFGEFAIDPETASLVYYAEDNDCCAQDVPCLRFCSELYPSTAITKVVASEANTISDRWDYDESLYSAIGNDYELGKRGKWRTAQTYIFKTDVDRLSSSPTSFDKNYNSGTYNLELFNWKHLGANGNKWLALNTVNKYSPNGNALEEENILGIKSSAKFGYHKTLPYFIAQNADYNSVMFESFENKYGSSLEDGILLNPLDGSIDTNTSHSGRSSFKLTFPANDGIELTQMEVSNQMLNKGMLFKVWIKTDFSNRAILDNYLKAGLEDVNNNIYVTKIFKKVAQVGEWYLYQAKITPSDIAGFSVGNVLKTYVKYEFSDHGTENVWIDDVRIQPMDAQSTAYVYDVTTHRLLATFDDQHFGLFYQYNAEGKLVRKLKETEKGIKTIQETQYNTPKINR